VCALGGGRERILGLDDPSARARAAGIVGSDYG
jgi:hypothetical protein